MRGDPGIMQDLPHGRSRNRVAEFDRVRLAHPDAVLTMAVHTAEPGSSSCHDALNLLAGSG